MTCWLVYLKKPNVFGSTDLIENIEEKYKTKLVFPYLNMLNSLKVDDFGFEFVVLKPDLGLLKHLQST